MKLELPPELRDEIAQAVDSLASVPTVAQFKAATQAAQRAIRFYQNRIPEIYADHNAEFYRERQHALTAGENCDACASIAGWRNHAHSIETEPSTPENIVWLRRIFDCALRGQLHLRA